MVQLRPATGVLFRVPVMAATLAWMGCGPTSPNGNPAPATPEAAHAHEPAAASHEHAASHGHAADQPAGEMSSADDSDTTAIAFAELSPEDRAIAEKQGICPVSGEPLGSMGVPIKAMAGDRAVFLCCKGCSKEFAADPDGYLAKLAASPSVPEGESATETPAGGTTPDAAPPASPDETRAEVGTGT